MEKVGEVIEAYTNRFEAQCYRLHESPALGSLVKTRDESVDIYGIVAAAETAGLDPSRRPTPRGEHEQSEEALFAANPQLAKLLATRFTALVVGHAGPGPSTQNSVRHYLPPRPARIHGFVYPCSDDEAREFAAAPDFLELLVTARGDFPVDDAVAACLRRLAQLQTDPQAFLVRAGKQLARLLGDDFPRLTSIVRRLKP